MIYTEGKLDLTDPCDHDTGLYGTIVSPSPYENRVVVYLGDTWSMTMTGQQAKELRDQLDDALKNFEELEMLGD